jgi:putative membrane protein
MSGNIDIFIHPRMKKYTIFAFIVFCILAYFQIDKFFSSHGETRIIRKGYLIFLIPILLGFIVNPKGLDPSIANKKGIRLVGPSGENISIFKNSESDNNKSSEDGLIEVNEKNYLKVVEDMGKNINNYKGKKIIISGFVFKKSNFNEDEFVVARALISCCAADSEFIGLMCKWEGSNKLKDDNWVKIEGIIDVTTYKDEDAESIIPAILVDKIEKIDKPKNEYIYP